MNTVSAVKNHIGFGNDIIVSIVLILTFRPWHPKVLRVGGPMPKTRTMLCWTWRVSTSTCILPINLTLQLSCSVSQSQTHGSQSRLNRDRYVIKTCQPAKIHVQYREVKHPCFLHKKYTYLNVTCIANWDISWHHDDHFTWWRIHLCSFGISFLAANTCRLMQISRLRKWQ